MLRLEQGRTGWRGPRMLLLHAQVGHWQPVAQKWEAIDDAVVVFYGSFFFPFLF